jgi:hypothetical protein
MGPARTKGAAAKLADDIMSGRPARVPSWGYHLLAARADVVLPMVRDVAEHGPAPKRARAVRLLQRVEALRDTAATSDGIDR